MKKKIIIGIPRSLFYYYYFPFCRTFFESLGCKIISSDKTNKEIMQESLDNSINELCIPLKLLTGHVYNLLKKKVDYIFLPYIITPDKKTYICPKLIASPDIIKSNIDNIKLITGEIDMNNFYSSLLVTLKEIMSKIDSNPVKIYSAYKSAEKEQKKFNRDVKKGYIYEEIISDINKKRKKRRNDKQKITIAIIAHTYILNDNYLNGDIINKLRNMNLQIKNSDMLEEKTIEKEILNFEKRPHWTLGNRVLGSALHYLKKDYIRGIIYITPFGCSSDSFIKEFIDAKNKDSKPFMTLTIDEQTGDAGMITRIEAFIDMIKRKEKLDESRIF
jgi:predicted nucleotide-binding protein (sugar kinase/HSP70/actin superfamily)